MTKSVTRETNDLTNRLQKAKQMTGLTLTSARNPCTACLWSPSADGVSSPYEMEHLFQVAQGQCLCLIVIASGTFVMKIIVVIVIHERSTA